MPRLTLHTLILGLAALLLVAGDARQATEFAVESGSRFWIDGNATTGPYSCEATNVQGQARVLHAPGKVVGLVAVPVESFDCGISRMNRDMRTALRSDRHPAIRFELQEAGVAEQVADAASWVEVRAVGLLAMAGAEQLVGIRAEGRRLQDGRVQVRGSHAFRMTDFGIEPPTGLLGLVRAHDNVVARFDIVAAER